MMDDFKLWIESRMRHVGMRAPLTQSQDRSLVMEPGDIVHFGPKTVEGGIVTPKYGKIISIKGQSVQVLRFNDAKLVEVPKTDLYEVPYSVVNGRFPTGNAPEVAGELEAMQEKGIIKRLKVWMKLSKKQYKRYEKYIKDRDLGADKLNPEDLMKFIGDDEDMGFLDLPEEPPQIPTPAPRLTTTTTTSPSPSDKPKATFASLSDRIKAMKEKKPLIPTAPSSPKSLADVRSQRRHEWVALKY